MPAINLRIMQTCSRKAYDRSEVVSLYKAGEIKKVRVVYLIVNPYFCHSNKSTVNECFQIVY